MKKATLYIHIGTYKTGTTSVQKAIRNCDDLKREKISDLGRPTYFREICIANEIDNTIIRKSREEISGRIKRESFLGRNKFIISAEHFSGNPNNGFKNSDIVAKILKAITEPLDIDVKIIVYLRRQDNFIQSLYTQEIHHGGSMSFKQFISGLDENSFNWSRLLESYAEVFGEDNIIVRRYGKEYLPDKNSVVQTFGEIIESEILQKYTKSSSANRGYSRDALEIARRSNPDLEQNEKKVLRNLLQKVSSRELFINYEYFDFEGRVDFLNRYAHSNKKVAENYFNETYLFEKPDRSIVWDTYNGLSEEVIIDHLVKIIREINSADFTKPGNNGNTLRNQLATKLFSVSPSLKEKIKLLFGIYY